jgi:hypothetical protein
MNSPRRLVRSVLSWPVDTQQGSRRNAMIASTALTELRRERDAVEEYLAARTPAAATVIPEAVTAARRDDVAEARRDVI